jgi:tetratricopeptide (TPR) repeat protein
MFYVLFAIAKYWQADFLYAESKRDYQNSEVKESLTKLNNAIKISPNEPVYLNELINTYTDFAIILWDDLSRDKAENMKDDVEVFSQEAVRQIEILLTMSPNNYIFRKSAITNLHRLASINPQYLLMAEKLALDSINFAPTDPRLFYIAGLVEEKLGKHEEAQKLYKKSVELKPDYEPAKVKISDI